MTQGPSGEGAKLECNLLNLISETLENTFLVSWGGVEEIVDKQDHSPRIHATFDALIEFWKKERKRQRIGLT